MEALQIDDPRVADMTASSKLVYLHVKADGPVAQQDLVERTQIPSKTVRDAVDRLVDQGIINRMRDPDDLRVVVYDMVDRDHPFGPSDNGGPTPADYERFSKRHRD